MTPEQERMLAEIAEVAPMLAGQRELGEDAMATIVLASVMLVTSEFWRNITWPKFEIREYTDRDGHTRWVAEPE